MPLANPKGAILLVSVLGVILCMNLTSCTTGATDTVINGASHSFLGSDDMSDYYYKKSDGWTYVFNNIEHMYDTDGSVARTLVAAPDTVRTLGYYSLAPNGDSLYRY